MHKTSYFVINGITLYRIFAAPFLLVLIFNGNFDVFKWLLSFSFFTDLIDGYLARRYKVVSILGTKLDSIGDDLTILCAIIGLFVFRFDFIEGQIVELVFLFILYLIQTILAVYKYHQITNYHTYLAKLSAILQGVFFIFIFFNKNDFIYLFYFALSVTAIQIIEEILLTLYLSTWKANVKGLYWVLKEKN